MKIGIANDHHGVHLKQVLTNYLESIGYTIVNYGADCEYVHDFGSTKTAGVDFPLYASKLAKGILNKEVEYGIAICGSSVGVTVTMNKFKGIYCGRVINEIEAFDAKNHDDINCLAFGQDIDDDMVCKVLKKFLETDFSGEERYVRRLNMIKDIENNG